jgi:hypothetical protein
MQVVMRRPLASEHQDVTMSALMKMDRTETWSNPREERSNDVCAERKSIGKAERGVMTRERKWIATFGDNGK